MMLVTKKGFKLWGSGMLVLACTFVLGLLMTEEVIDGMSLGELAFIFLVLYPMAIGVTQRWFWNRFWYE